MQTFLPLPTVDFSATAKVLDNKRLNKQALEGWQILLTLLELDPEGNHRTPKGWVNHPAVKMWRDHEPLLWVYVMCMVREWKARGFSTTIGDKATETIRHAYDKGRITTFGTTPSWMKDESKFEAISRTHRLALLVKDYQWYSQFHWPEDSGTPPESYEYVWE